MINFVIGFVIGTVAGFIGSVAVLAVYCACAINEPCDDELYQ
jgi:hypothetical protein